MKITEKKKYINQLIRSASADAIRFPILSTRPIMRQNTPPKKSGEFIRVTYNHLSSEWSRIGAYNDPDPAQRHRGILVLQYMGKKETGTLKSNDFYDEVYDLIKKDNFVINSIRYSLPELDITEDETHFITRVEVPCTTNDV